jgi:SAM-dependent methyltransferase
LADRHGVHQRRLEFESVARRASFRLLRRRFTFAGRSYPYFVHPYLTTWRTERCVEIPLANAALDRHRGGRVLEIGNVLGHYDRSGHDVVDKYEHAQGVLNVDVLDYHPSARYELVLAVSTLEHVGFDGPEPPDPDKPRRALEHLATLLAPGGELLVTLPLGYNSHVDEALGTGGLRFDELGFLRRVSSATWRQVSAGEVGTARYGKPYPFANAVAIGTRLREKPT